MIGRTAYRALTAADAERGAVATPKKLQLAYVAWRFAVVSYALRGGFLLAALAILAPSALSAAVPVVRIPGTIASYVRFESSGCSKRYVTCVTSSPANEGYVLIKYTCRGSCNTVYWSAGAYENTSDGPQGTSVVSASIPSYSEGVGNFLTITTNQTKKSRNNEFFVYVRGCSNYSKPRCEHWKVGVTIAAS